jgi:hypothetical protein
MAFMVKNPGLVPGFDSLKNGDVRKRRKAMWDVLVGGWRACEKPQFHVWCVIDHAYIFN